MKKLLCLLLLCLSSAQAAIQITDDKRNTVVFDKTPQRIVSLLPSLTESICALGQCQRLVGVDRYSNHPKEVRTLPQLGGGLDPNIEAVVALKPDVVLLATSSRAGAHLQSLGIKVLALEPRTLADVQRVLAQLGQLLGVPDAARVWRQIDAAVSAAAQSIPPQAQNQRVYFEASSGPYAASESSFIGEILIRLGAKNIAPGHMGPFPKLSPEFVVRANPDVIMMGERSTQTLSERPGWNAMRAVRLGHVCAFTIEQSDMLVRAGPRMAEAARLMAACLNRIQK